MRNGAKMNEELYLLPVRNTYSPFKFGGSRRNGHIAQTMDGWMDGLVDHMDNLGAMSDWTLELNRRRWNPKAFFTPIHLCRQQFALLLCTATAEVNRFAVSRSWWNTHKEHLVCPQNSSFSQLISLWPLSQNNADISTFWTLVCWTNSSQIMNQQQFISD